MYTWRLLSLTLLLVGNLSVGFVEKASADNTGTARNKEALSIENLYKNKIKELEQISSGCRERTKIQGAMTYRICTRNNQPVEVSEALTEWGDGIGFWLENNQVRAIRFFHSGELVTFNKNGVLETRFVDDKIIETQFTPSERQHLEKIAKTGYQRILQQFKN